MNIVYTTDNKFIPQVGAGIVSVCENNKEFKSINFYIIGDKISKYNQELLIKTGDIYGRNVILIELKDLSDYFDFTFDTKGWNKIVLARLLLDHLLPNSVEKLIYLDGDTIVIDSLKELWETDLKTKVLGASIEPTMNKKRYESLDMQNHPYYNAGVLLIDMKKWREQNTGQEIVDYYRKKKGNLFANDQDAINGSQKDNIYTLLPKYNYYNIFYYYPYNTLKKIMGKTPYITKEEFDNSMENPVIIHYLGEERPWRKGNFHKFRKEFENYLSKSYWKDTKFEEGWYMYFVCLRIFNFISKPVPIIRYKVIDGLIPVFMKYRAKKLKK